MKTVFSCLSLLLTASFVSAQTALVLFQNDNNSLISNALTGGLIRSNEFIRAQLYFAPDGVTNETDFVPVASSTLVGGPPGRYAGGSKVVPVAPGTPILIQVKAYEFLYGSTYEEAEAAPAINGRRALIGKSAIARVIAGGGPTNSSRAVGPFTVGVAGGGAYFSVHDLVVAEGSNGVVTANFTISVASPQSEAIQVDFATIDGTALAGQDYVATNGTLAFEPGESSKVVAVVLTADAPPEPDETFFLDLSQPVGGFIIRPRGTCLITEVRISEVSIDTSVSFNTVLDRRYVVEKTADLIVWQPVAGATNLAGSGRTMTVVDRASGCTSFMVYRARLLDP
jgi:hypothetical protein